MVATKCLSFVRLVVLAACTPVVLFGSECGDMCRSMVSSFNQTLSSFDDDFDYIRTTFETLDSGVELLYDDLDSLVFTDMIFYVPEEEQEWYQDYGSNLRQMVQDYQSTFEQEKDWALGQLDSLKGVIDSARNEVLGVDCSKCDSTSSDDDDDDDDDPSGGGGGGDNPSGGQCSCTCSDELADISAKIAAIKTSVDNIRADLQEHKEKLEAIRQLLYDIKGLINQIKDHQKRIDDYLYDDLTEKLKELKELLEEMRDNVKEYYDDFKKVQMLALTNSVNEVRKLNEQKFNTLINMISNNIPFCRDFVTMISNNFAGIHQGFYTNELLLSATTSQLERIASLIPTNGSGTRDYFINLNYSNAVFYLDNDGNSFSIADLDDTLNQSTNSFDWAEFAKLPWFTRMEYLMLKLAGIYEGSVSNADASEQMSGKETLEQQEDDLKDQADSLSQSFDECVEAGKEFVQSFKSFTNRGEAVNKLHILSDFLGDEPLEVDLDGEFVSTCHVLFALFWTVFFTCVLIVFCVRTFRFWFNFSLYIYRWITGVVSS